MHVLFRICNPGPRGWGFAIPSRLGRSRCPPCSRAVPDLQSPTTRTSPHERGLAKSPSNGTFFIAILSKQYFHQIKTRTFMTSPIYKSIGLALACTLGIFGTSCNNSTTTTTSSSDSTGQTTTTTTTTSSDSMSKMKQAAGAVEQGAADAETALKEAMDRNPDSAFVAQVAGANYEEIKILQAGIDNGASPALKEHARMMIKDHNGLAKKLADYASSKNYPIPTADNGKADKVLSDMSAKTGADWDKAWANFMFNAHEKAIGVFEGAKSRVKDPQVQALIASTLPTLQRHLEMVKSLLATLK